MGQASSPKCGRKPLNFGSGSEGLAQEIARLLELDVPALRQEWAALLGSEPSPHLGRMMMIRVIAYRLQEKAFGALKPSAQRVLDRVGDGGSESARQQIPKRAQQQAQCSSGSGEASGTG